MPLIAAAVIAGVGSVAGGAIAAHGAGSAANTQANAELQAANLQAQEAQNALNFQEGVYGNSQQEIAPYLNAGYGGLAQLEYLLGIPSALPNASSAPSTGVTQPPADPLAKYQGQSFSSLVNSGDPNVSPNAQTTDQWVKQGIPFQNVATSDGRYVAVRTNPNPQPSSLTSGVPSPASSGINIPTNTNQLVNPNLGAFGSLLTPFSAPSLDNTTDPGYLARLALGQQSVENSAAARGGLLSSNTTRALDQYTQDYASNEYNNVYNRAFNTFETNQANTYNRLAALAGLGQQAVNTSTGAGQSAAGNVTNIDLGAGAQIGSSIGAAGSARASGYLNQGNIIGNTISGLGSNLGLLYLLGYGGQGADPNTLNVNWGSGMSGAYNALYGSPGPGM